MGLAQALSLRLERRLLTLRAATARRALTPQGGRVARTRLARLPRGAICVCLTMRDEARRLPLFFDWHRALGADFFLVIDNGSTDGGPDWVLSQPDAMLWRAEGSYRAARFGMDWVNALLGLHATGRWVLVLDADELLIYPHHDARPLRALADRLEAQGRRSLGALLLDLYPGPAPSDADPGGRHAAQSGARAARGALPPPLDDAWFDAAPPLVERDPRYANLWIRGGPRLRTLFADRPRLAPALNKTPFLRWRRGDAFVSSTHAALPRGLNRTYARDGTERLSAALLHLKLLDGRPGDAARPDRLAEHHAGGREHAAWAAAAAEGATFWTPESTRLTGWEGLAALGLMGGGAWA